MSALPPPSARRRNNNSSTTTTEDRAAMEPPSEALADLLVALGVQKCGASEWEAVVRVVAPVLAHRLEGAPESLPEEECERRYAQLGSPGAATLPGIISELQARRVVELEAAIARYQTDGGDGDGAPAVSVSSISPPSFRGSGRNAGRTRTGGPAEFDPEAELEDPWSRIAEDCAARRVAMQGTLVKMLQVSAAPDPDPRPRGAWSRTPRVARPQSLVKHKWAYPFKKPVTEKEAPDYREYITNPMDLATARKRIEAGTVTTVDLLVDDLVLIFDNAMVYNAKGSDYHKMALTLKEVVKAQQGLYNRWAAAKAAKGDGDAEAAGDEEAAPAAAPPPARDDSAPSARRKRAATSAAAPLLSSRRKRGAAS